MAAHPAAALRDLPQDRAFWLLRARVPACLIDEAVAVQPSTEGLAVVDIRIEGGRVSAVRAAAIAPDAVPEPAVDLRLGQVWPCFVDLHTHLDKGQMWQRSPNADGSFEGAIAAVRLDRDRHRRWTAEDLRRRMEFGLECAFAHGTSAIRTHLDTKGPAAAVSWEIFSALRSQWRGRIELQAASIEGIDSLVAEPLLSETIALVRRHGGILGTVTRMQPGLILALELLFQRALDYGLDLDFHVDETADPAARSLCAIAETALRMGFPRRIVVGHCCSLSLQPEDEARRTIDLVAKAGLTVVSLPMCNMYLQDRAAGRTPRWRGVTDLHALRKAGVPVAIASDNTRDPFYPWGDLDGLEVFRAGVRILHLDHPFGDWPAAITRTPADAMGLATLGRIAPGLPADLVLFRGRTWSELLSRPEHDRVVLRSGWPIDTTLPDYSRLDDLVEV